MTGTPLGSATPAGSPTAIESASPQAAADFVIVAGQSFGPINADATEESLKQQFGADKVKREKMYVGDGIEMDGAVVFPNEPEKRVEVFWFEEDPKRVQLVQIHGEKSEWKTAQGVTLGTTLQELEKLNGKPFAIMGLGWDFGGTVSDWKGGALDGLTLRCDATDVQLSEAESATILGDQVVQSSLPAMQKANPKVSKITLAFPLPEGFAPASTETPSAADTVESTATP